MFFWPDLASYHYGKKAKDFYFANNVHVVPKEANPPNCPELRPIDRYWAHMKKKLKYTNSVARNIQDFKKKWRNQVKNIDKVHVQTLRKGKKAKVRKFWHG